MESEIKTKLLELEEKINKIYISVEKTRKYFLWTMIVTIVVIVLPLIVLTFILPSFVSNYVGSLQNLGL
jgi:type II secretory pathway component PulF